MRSRILLVSAATVIAVGGLAACSSSSEEKASDTPAQLQGTWTGSASYADVSGETKGGPESLVIERQEGVLLWGYTEYVDFDGSKVKNTVTGTLTQDEGIVLTEPGSLWEGEVDGDSMTVVVSWTKGEKDHGAFEMTLTKQ